MIRILVKSIDSLAKMFAYLLQDIDGNLSIGTRTGVGGVHYYLLRLDEPVFDSYLHALADELVQQALIAQPLFAELAQSARINDV